MARWLRSYGAVSTALICFSMVTSRRFGRLYGAHPRARFVNGAAVCLLAQQAGVSLALRRASRIDGYRLRRVDLLTLSRSLVCAVIIGVWTSGIRDRRGHAGRFAWYSLVYGCTVSDWLDGRFARRLGASQFGALLDLETDSLLTGCTAVAATSWGDLPRTAMLPPLLRYVALHQQMRRGSYETAVAATWPGERMLGVTQMVLLLAATCPYGSERVRAAMENLAPIHLGLQLTAFALRLTARTSM